MSENSPAVRSGKKGELRSAVASMSDRAIQRVVGGNAFLRGRIYARRNCVSDLREAEAGLTAKVTVRNDDPNQLKVELNEDGSLRSHCTCSGWRGPTSHCKHVAAVLVAVRDRERPPRARKDAEPDAEAPTNGRAKTASASTARNSSSSKRRRSRRRRRGGAAGSGDAGANAAVGVVSARDLAGNDTRNNDDVWLPTEGVPRTLDFEFRMLVRSASIVVTPVSAGSRSAVPIADALAAFSVVPGSYRPLFRALGRHVVRGQAASSELRGEDAAEVLWMLRGKRVLLEPASMELRFGDEPLKPRVELDAGGDQSVRLRVAFELKAGNRRFSLSNGAWFEGTPGWHLDTNEGFARPLAETVTPGWLQRLYRSPSLVFRITELPRLLTDFIPRVAASLDSDLPDLTAVADVVDSLPKFQLRIQGDLLEATASLQVMYGKLALDVSLQGFPSPLAFDSKTEGTSGRAKPQVIRRDVGAEMSAVQALVDLGFECDEGSHTLSIRGDQAVAFWTNGISTLPEEWDKMIPHDLAEVTIRDKPVAAQARVSSGVDWLSLEMMFASDGVAVNKDELRACLSQGKRLVKLSDGSYAPVEADKVDEVLSRMAELYIDDGAKDKLPLSQAGRVQDLMRLVDTPAVSSPAQKLFDKINHVGAVDTVPKPRNLKATLRPYQKEGFSWLVFLHGLATGGILADDMGLGKTLQTIGLLLWLKNKNKKGLSLVVAPTSVVPNWKREIEKFAPSLRPLIWQGPDRHKHAESLKDVDVLITSYALIRRDEEFLQGLDLKYAILDEAQHIKNPLSATARAAKRLQTERRLALTGTPIENRLSEIWSIFDFVSPGLLGSLSEFDEKYVKPIDKGEESAVNRLRAAIHPFVMRRTKGEVAQDLPEKIEQEMVVAMADGQGQLYEQILRQVRESVLSEIDQQGVANSQIQILAALTRLRQVACDPRLLKLEAEFDEEDSGKLSALRDLVQEATSGGHRVLVFSQFVHMLKLIREVLDEDQVSYEYLDGATKDRQERVDRFNTDESLSVFLISLKAGGTGLNLTGADTVVHFDPWWNPAVEDQATDRAHRIGQRKVVSVYRLIAKGTVEEKILKLSEKKRTLVSNVLSSEGSPVKGLSREDVEQLLTLDA